MKKGLFFFGQADGAHGTAYLKNRKALPMQERSNEGGKLFKAFMPVSGKWEVLPGVSGSERRSRRIMNG